MLIFCSLLFSGCHSVETRIRDNWDFYQSLSPQERSTIRAEQIEKEFSTDMVYLAWGAPNQVDSYPFAKGELELWIYTQSYGEPVYHNIKTYDRKHKKAHYHTQVNFVWFEYAVKFVLYEEGEVVRFGDIPFHPTIHGPVGAYDPFSHSYSHYPNCENKPLGRAMLHSYHRGCW